MLLKPFNHKTLRTTGIAYGTELTVFTDQSSLQADVLICSSDTMLDKLLPDLGQAILQWLDASSEALIFEHPIIRPTQLIVSYEGMVSDLTQRLGIPLCVARQAIEASPHSKNADEIVALPPDFEQALKELIHRNRKVIQLYKDGSFKIGEGA